MLPVAVCLIVKDERSDIAEWVAHYANLGVDRIIAYDDDSKDGTLELLEGLGEHFPIEVVPWNTSEKNRQLAAYTNCLERFGPEFSWIGFLDTDEFLIPSSGQTIKHLVDRHKDHDAFSINWQIFGMDGVIDTNGALVMETFLRRADTQFNGNRNVKTFVRPSVVTRALNPHYFQGPKIWTDVMGNPIEWESPGIVKEGGIVSGDWRLHHYSLRSERHLDQRMRRPRATGAAVLNRESYLGHDRNEVFDDTALPVAAATRERLIKWGLIRPGVLPIALRRNPKPDRQGPILPRLTPDIHFQLDSLEPEAVRGWAVDNSARDANPLHLDIIIDGRPFATIVCDQRRHDLVKHKLPEHSGFTFVLPSSYFDGKEHSMTVQTLQGDVVPIRMGREVAIRKSFQDIWRPRFISHIDGFRSSRLRGWVLREYEGSRLGGVQLEISCNGRVIGTTSANMKRRDVAHIHNADEHCGFEYDIPPEYQREEAQEFAVRIAEFDYALHGSPVTQAFNLTTALGGSSMAPPIPFTLGEYDPWSFHYRRALEERIVAERTSHPEILAKDCFVSILCPVYRPLLSDFVQAVESVLRQTYKNWELILVDDGSQDPQLTAQLYAFSLRDPRIKVSSQPTNKGIAGATNHGLTLASGQYVAFLDHDDLLEPCAIEVMVRRAKSTGALLLYSDEDNITSEGHFINPAFKPEWNYRLLLSVNYLCHFVMVDRQALCSIGGIPETYDGAQDHAMLLRLSEEISSDKIHHVPEVLYHWRITSTSTASGIEAKPYALDAGVRAVGDHLRRRNVEAKVTNVSGATWYRIEWPFKNTPSVSVIIPFKDEVSITEECLRRVLATDYPNLNVILVENNSTTSETTAFCERAILNPQVQCLHMSGPFNYSRLNNTAARQTKADYLVLMNNDLHPRSSDWLRVMVNEATADPSVGIVGGKFFYPQNQTVQHAGVIVGIGGVACHIHGGIYENEPGYGGRALLAQELSAVTGACMLVNRGLYWKVGGLDEEDLPIAFSDIDLCLKARQLGARIIWTPDFVADHHESLSRGSDSTDPIKAARFAREFAHMQARWGDLLARDPSYSPFFRLDVGDAFWHLRDPRVNPVTRRMTAKLIESRWCHG